LVHDLAEAVCGDIVLLDDVGDREAVSAQLLSIDSKDEKHRIERAALESILAQLGESPDAQEIREEVLSLWLEYEEQSTAEARFVKECDKLEMALQAHEYMGRGSDPLDEFLASVRGKVQSPHMRSIQEEIDPASKP
jgi:putative hydrolase of HD superfamily